VTAEGPGTALTTTLSSLTVGDDTAHTSCQLSGSVWYCPVTLANSNGAMVATPSKNGYVQKDYALGTPTNRGSNTASQVSSTVSSVQFAYKITSVTTQVLAASLATALATLSVGDDTAKTTCSISGSTWYCPVLLTNSDGTMVAVPTLDGYVQKDYGLGTPTNRGANTASQVSSALTGIEYAYTITGIATEGPGNAIITSVSSLAVGDDTGQDSCARSGSTWYCPTTTANSNGALVAVPTLDGYVQKSYALGTQTNRGSNTASQVSSTVSGIQYAYKINGVTSEGPANDLTGTLSSLTMGDTTGEDSCELNGGAWYCPVRLTYSDQTLVATPTKDGYVQKDYNLGTQTNRGAHTTGQVSSTVSSVQFAYRITSVSTEGPANALTTSLSALTVGDTTGENTCQLNSGTWYCPVVLANSNQVLVATPTKDGYVEKDYSLATPTTRGSHSASQVSSAVNSIQFAYRITGLTSEGPANDLTGSLSSLTVGDATGEETCQLNSGTWYCPVRLTYSDQTLVATPTKDGYVEQDYNLGTQTNRGANTVAQVSSTVSGLKFAYKITGVTSEGPGTDLTGSLSALTMGDATGEDTCQLNSGTWYCPVRLTYSDQTLVATPTKDGYVQKDYNLGTQTNRGAHTTGQVSSTVSGVQFGYKVTGVASEGPTNDLTGSLSALTVGDGTGKDTCTLNSGSWYCPVRTSYSDQTPISARPTKDGYVQADYDLAAQTTRSSNTAVQVATTVASVRFGYKVTGVTTETLGSAITGSLSSLTVGDASGQDTCQLYSGAWYCPVRLTYSDQTLVSTPTLDGYVRKSTYQLTAGIKRTGQDSAQVSDTITGMEYAYKIAGITSEGPANTLTSSVTVLTVGDDTGQTTCTRSGSTWFCPVILANSNGALEGTPTLNGYVKQSYGLTVASTRGSHDTAQVADTIASVQFGYKVTGVSTEGPGTALTGSLSTLTLGDSTGKTTCQLNGGAWYCPVVTANSDQTPLAVLPTKDGYVQKDYSIGTQTARSVDTAAQVSTTVSGIQFAYKVTGVTSEGPANDLTGILSALTVGDATGQNACTLNSGAWYCPVMLANSDQTLVATPTKDGYVRKTTYALTSGTTRGAHTTGQVTDTITGLQFAYKVTAITSEGPTNTLTTSVTALTVGDATGQTACQLHSGSWYCPTVLANSDQTLVATPTKDGYVQQSYSLTSGTTRGSHDSTQVSDTLASVKFAYKVTSVATEGPANVLTSTLSSLSVGDATGQNACQLNGGAWYCPVVTANSDQTLVATPTLDGYVQASYGLTAGNTRGANTAAQVADTVTGLQFGYKVTGVTSEGPANDLTGSLSSLTVGDASGQTACQLHSGAWYCPVVTANSDQTLVATPTKDGYVRKATYALTSGTTRGAHSTAQVADTVTGIQFAYKVTGITTEGPASDLTGSLTSLTVGDDTGQNACQLNSGAWYCPVVLANTNGALVATPTKDGYVQGSYGLTVATTRGSHDAGQVADTVVGIQFAYKVTSITTEGPGADLTSSVTGLTVGDDTGKDACLLNSGAWYCPVVLANSNGALKARPVKDGYVEEDHTLTGASTRGTHATARSTGTVAGVRFSYTVQVEDQRTTAGSVTGATVTAGASDVGCTFNVDRYYCPITLADDTGADADADAAKTGYVTTHWDAALAAGRTQHTDSPLAVTVTDMPFAQKL
ncbi:MAG: hypothetical protein QGG26_17135, partial [Candidatus Undinarchaeales archaeon]|nr:hypothetical protein [Candidatus Undinarchaeales archaeon]